MNTVNEALNQLLKEYKLTTREDYKNALKQIIQEIALFGLSRAKFFEHAALYGGTALRILYGLDRFSEDLDFSLLEPQPNFKLEKYYPAIINELASYGLSVSIDGKNKEGQVKSAFVKANTTEHLLRIGASNPVASGHKEETLKIKIEVDTDPPPDFNTEAKFLLRPAPFSVRTFVQEDLFAGKMHAILCRNWKNNVKGRDWYDLIWFLKNNIPVNLTHLKRRMQQSKHLQTEENLDEQDLQQRLQEKIGQIDWKKAKQDVAHLLANVGQLDLWSADFFKHIIEEYLRVCLQI
jgi:predicted nucleotidyltransferase component of viral defense system